MGQVWSTLQHRDPHRQTLAVALLLLLVRISKSYEGLRAYTFWNVAAVLVFFWRRARGWAGPLLTNSVAIFVSYRTASADAHSHFVENSGKSEAVYLAGDFVVHFLPVVAMIIWHKRNNKFVKPQAAAMGMLGQFFFAYSQAGKLDLSQIYVPHDVNAAWAAALLGHIFAPMLSNNYLKGNYGRSILALLFMFTPYLMKKLGLRKLRNRDTIRAERIRRRKANTLAFLSFDGSDSEGIDSEIRCVMCQRRRKMIMANRGDSNSHSSRLRDHGDYSLSRRIIDNLTGLPSIPHRGLQRSRSSSNFLEKISIV